MFSNWPLRLTLLRIIFIPFFGVLYFLPFTWAHPVASILFLCAAVTDWLDGYLARTLAQTTELGAFLDPVADKLLVGFALVAIVGANGGILLSVASAIIVMREIAISALREWMAGLGKRASVAVGYVGKVKTTVQMLALLVLIAYTAGQSLWWWAMGVVLLWAAALLTLWSMVLYLKIAWRDLTLSSKR